MAALTKQLLKDINAHERDAHIKFQEKGHKYFIHGKTGFTSVTTLVHQAFEKFNADKIIDKMMASPKWPDSPYFGKTKSEIKKQWKDNGQEAAKMGTAMHEMFEYHYNGIFPEKIEAYKDTTEYAYFKDFIRDHPELVPYRTEWNVYHEDYKWSGSIDFVVENEDGTLSILDWKRCKKIEKSNNFGKRCLVKGLSHIHDSNYWHYCLQLNLYKLMLEKKYDKIVKDLHLVVIHPDNESQTYEKILVPILPENDLLCLVKE
tara:strand:+ start:1020 stop:1799 length:780 start_codon:yes stop_codon:yes gene_type:complete